MNSGLEIRLYSINDRDECLRILEGNTPEFFTPKDRSEVLNFLDNLPGPYFVVEDRGAIIACGGWAMQEWFGEIVRDKASDVIFSAIGFEPYATTDEPRLCDCGQFRSCTVSLQKRASTSSTSWPTDMVQGCIASRWTCIWT